MTIQLGPLTLEGSRLYLSNEAIPIRLHRKERCLLKILMEHPNQIVSREMLMKEVWETDYMGDTRTLDVHICWLRQKLEPNPAQPQYLVTHRGEGYRLCVPDTVQ